MIRSRTREAILIMHPVIISTYKCKPRSFIIVTGWPNKPVCRRPIMHSSTTKNTKWAHQWEIYCSTAPPCTNKWRDFGLPVRLVRGEKERKKEKTAASERSHSPSERDRSRGRPLLSVKSRSDTHSGGAKGNCDEVSLTFSQSRSQTSSGFGSPTTSQTIVKESPSITSVERGFWMKRGTIDSLNMDETKENYHYGSIAFLLNPNKFFFYL